MLSAISSFCLQQGVEFFSILPAHSLPLHNTKPLPFVPKTAFLALFPYYNGQPCGNLSRYCCVTDYHKAIPSFLNSLWDSLSPAFPHASIQPFCDTFPIDEVTTAQMAGLGSKGLHGLLINEKYGTYCFIGGFLTDAPLPLFAHQRKNLCTACQRCVIACPSGAISFTPCAMPAFHAGFCLSSVTQKKENLTRQEQKAILKNGYAFGCDQCQKACPYNKNIPLTPFAPFQTNVFSSLSLSDLEGLSNRAFLKTYGHMAFSWRGISPLKRNLSLLENAKTPSDIL